MNQSIFNKILLGALLAISMGLTACAKKTGSAVKVAGRGGAITTQDTCSNGQAAAGIITNSTNLESATKVLASATLPTSSFGRIGPGGVKLTLDLKAGSNGQLGSEGSLLIEITDSFVGQIDSKTNEAIGPYKIEMNKMVTSLSKLDTARRTFTAYFQDEYGAIQVQGSYDNTTAQGTVIFKNFVSQDSAVPANQVIELGKFSVPSCSLFK